MAAPTCNAFFYSIWQCLNNGVDVGVGKQLNEEGALVCPAQSALLHLSPPCVLHDREQAIVKRAEVRGFSWEELSGEEVGRNKRLKILAGVGWVAVMHELEISATPGGAASSGSWPAIE